MEVRRLLQIELDCFHSFFEMVHIHALNLLVLISGPIKPKGFPAHNGSVNRIIVGADILVIFRDRALLGYADDSQREGGAFEKDGACLRLLGFRPFPLRRIFLETLNG